MAKRSPREKLLRLAKGFEPVLEISPTAIVVTDLEAHVVAWSPAAERLFGYTAEEAIGQNLDDLVAKTDELHAAAVEYSARTTKDQIHAITRRTRKDGTLVDVELLGAPLIVDGEPVGTLGMYHDITDLQRQREYYAALLEVNPTAITTVDTNDILTSWNPAAEQLFGYTAEEAIGRHIDDLVADREDLKEEAAKANLDVAREGGFRLTSRRTRKDGSLVDVDIVGASIHVAGERVGAHAFYHDITAIQRQKRYYEALLEVSPTAIIGIDPQGNVTSWNPAAERLFGYSAEEAMGRHVDDLVANREELRAEALDITRRIAEGEVRYVGQRTRKDGSLVDVQVTGAPIYMGGELVGMYGLFNDISELQQQRRYYEALVQSSPVAIALLDAQGTVTSWNPAAERLFGYSAEEAIGRNIDDLVAKNDAFRAEAASMTEQGISGNLAHAITRRTRKDGTLVDVEIFGAPVTVAGEPVGLYAMYHDISEIQRQKQFYESLVEVSPVAVVLVDNDYRVTTWNPAAEELFGYTAEEAIGRHIEALVCNSEEIREEVDAVKRLEAAGEPVHMITRRTRKDGSLVDVELLDVPVFIGGERVGFYVLYHDIRDLQRARRDAEAATQAKSAFLATMSHEIRTPLNAVIGMTGLLLDTALGQEQRHYAEVIRNSGDALLGVINDILDFSKIEAGRLDLESAPFDLRESLESALELVAAGAVKKGLDVAYDMDPDVPSALIGDATRLRQIVMNLLNNAVKFTEHGEVVATVGAERLDGDPTGDGADRYRLHFAVRDTGIGIPPDRMDRLFESFSQVDRSTTRRYGGTGLGLAISKRLAEQMGGTMWAESRVGEGSTFHFTIEAEAAPAPVRAYERTGGPQLKRKRVLIVDDNATNRHILSRQTQSWGMLPRETESPAEALQWIERGDPFDLAILDMHMPDMDGLTLAAEIRRHRDATSLPLVMLTSLGRTEGGNGHVDFAAYLTKPIKPSQLFDALMGVFGAEPIHEEPAAAAVEADEHLAERLPLRILVVEDNAVNQQLATLMLQKVGYRADVAANGVEALEAVDRQPYDVVLMDVEMPEMDGLEATRQIHLRWPADQRPHIIAVTANALAGERERCLRAGMDDYITKPLRMEDLTGSLARAAPRATGRQTAAVLDTAVVRRLAESLGDEGMRELIGTFLEAAPGQTATMRASLEGGGAKELRRAAHTLKSNAASFGATTLADLSRELEAAAKSEALNGANDLIDRIEAELTRVMAELERVRAGA